jgi:hypothetical protein
VEVKLTHLQSEFLFDLSLTLQSPLDIGLVPEGHRLIIMTSGGHSRGRGYRAMFFHSRARIGPGSGRMGPSLSTRGPASRPPKAR